MADEVRISGLTIANSVIEKVVSLAAAEVPGIVSVGISSVSGFMQNVMGKTPEPFVAVTEDGESLILRVHVTVEYGKKLVDVANELRKAIADAINVQIGINVAAVDVYIDGIVFDNE